MELNTIVFTISKLTAGKGHVSRNNLSIFCSSVLVFLLKRKMAEGIMFIFSTKLYFLTESPSIRISDLFFFLEKKKDN